MALVNGFTLLDIIKERNVIAGAFNTTNLETTVAILKAVERSKIPTFIQIAPTNVKLGGYEIIYDMVERYAKHMETPVALHLDHGKDFSDFKKACEAGFTSVMIDGAEFDFDENIAFTKRAVDFAKQYDIPVEAELGAISGKEDDHVGESDSKTDVNQVVEYVERTGCSMLAVSVGNVHGLDEEPNIDFDLLKKIYEVSPVPIVIHGGSGIPDEDIQRMNHYGVVKLNIASDLRNGYIKSIGQAYDKNNNEANLIKVLVDAADTVEAIVYNKILAINGLEVANVE